MQNISTVTCGPRPTLFIIASLLVAVLPLINNSLHSQETVDEARDSAQIEGPSIANSELESAEAVEFTNYTGPYTQVDSLESIIAIGSSLVNGLAESEVADYAGKYSIQHIISEEPSSLFDADILSLSLNAAVDHIRNLRHIISGYLQAQYGYNAADADTISTFVTYYNAFYRSQAEYFAQKFSPAVNSALTPESIGLSTNYTDWPGSTQIIIPLSANPVLAQEPSPNLDETGQQKVAEYLDNTESSPGTAKGLRQDMVELRQEKLTSDQSDLANIQDELQQENQKIQQALELAQATEASTDDLAEREVAKEVQTDLQNQLQDNQKGQNNLDAAQQTIAQRQESLKKERRELQQKDDPAPVVPADVVLLPVNNRFFQLFGIDSSNLKISTRSAIDSIRSPDFVANENGYVVVADVAQGNSRSTRLAKIEPDLSQFTQGNNDIHPDSGVWSHNGQLFAFLANGSLARFNADFELQAESSELLQATVKPQFLSSYVLVKSTGANFVLLDMDTLVKVQELSVPR